MIDTLHSDWKWFSSLHICVRLFSMRLCERKCWFNLLTGGGDKKRAPLVFVRVQAAERHALSRVVCRHLLLTMCVGYVLHFALGMPYRSAENHSHRMSRTADDYCVSSPSRKTLPHLSVLFTLIQQTNNCVITARAVKLAKSFRTNILHIVRSHLVNQLSVARLGYRSNCDVWMR